MPSLALMMQQKQSEDEKLTFLSPPLGQLATYRSKPLNMSNHPKMIAAVPINQCNTNHAGLIAVPLLGHIITILSHLIQLKAISNRVLIFITH